MNETGLLVSDLEMIRQALRQIPVVKQAILFGSRAKGNPKQGSDVDLALVGDNVSHWDVLEATKLLNQEYPLPYFFDVTNLREILNPALRDHINRVGMVIYTSK